jgi:hypothetical protein
MITRNSAGLYPWSKDLEASSDVRLREREGFAMLLGWLEYRKVKGGEVRSLPERLRDAVDRAGARQGKSVRTR